MEGAATTKRPTTQVTTIFLAQQDYGYYGGKIKETDKGKGYPHLLHEPSSRKKSGLIFDWAVTSLVVFKATFPTPTHHVSFQGNGKLNKKI